MSAQNLFSSDKIEGRVYSKDGDVAATHVLNITTKRASITDENGFFAIPAKLYDTIVFSAIQFKRKEIVVTADILKSKMLSIPLEEALTELDEVVVMPYNLTGNIFRDTKRMDVEPVVTASTLGLPNAYVKVPTMAERQLFEATSGGGLVPLNAILNGISGRTKMLKNRLARNQKYARTQRVREMYADSLFRIEFKIPEEKIDDFMYFCEVDSVFQTTVNTHDRFKIWDYMRDKSLLYRQNNGLEIIQKK
ncbi:carboxypeptidase-like regulatory domain-containing protein [Maribacter halichondriae]|uniref:carboxypeptidase-like regulatory domain-containing protein n=1 Tax=Maribacter halichondriae TaxID=2980554 RepID=UPI002359F16D|nr:carboxypeptidase-like regulatory domain-containing protein [Maribacter sp. Hal144]